MSASPTSITFVVSSHLPFPQASLCSFRFTSSVFPTLPPPTRPSSSYTLGSELTWAPGTIFSLSQCLPLVCAGAGGTQRRPHSTQRSFPLAKHGKKKKRERERKKKLQPDPTAEKVVPPSCPACYSFSVHAETPVLHAFLRLPALQ